MSNDSDGDLNLMKEMHRLRIKTTLALVKKMSFEEFLKKYFEINPEISACDLFQNAVWDSLLAVEYAIKEKDDELIGHINALIAKLESEEGNKDDVSIGIIFAKLIIKAKNVCEAGLPVPSIVITFEFKYFLDAFKEMMIKKIFIADKLNADKLNNEAFYNLMARYSNN